MMKKVRERVEFVRARTNSGDRGPIQGGNEGISTWFAKYAPEVKRTTAYRMEAVGDSVAASWTGLPDTLKKKIALPDLVTSKIKALEKIDRRLPKKQKELFEYVDGTSQRSWLDQFVQKNDSSYDRTTRGKGKTRKSQAQHERDLREHCKLVGKALNEVRTEREFYVLNEAELDGLIDLAEGLADDAKAWRKKTKREREEIASAQLAKLK